MLRILILDKDKHAIWRQLRQASVEVWKIQSKGQKRWHNPSAHIRHGINNTGYR
jgi:hypothetical protein